MMAGYAEPLPKALDPQWLLMPQWSVMPHLEASLEGALTMSAVMTP